MMNRRGEHASRTGALTRNVAVFVLLTAAVAMVGISGLSLLKTSPAGGALAPASPPVIVCGNASLLTGPSSAPPGAVTVPSGDNASLFASVLPASTTYWFAPGTHTLGSGRVRPDRRRQQRHLCRRPGRHPRRPGREQLRHCRLGHRRHHRVPDHSRTSLLHSNRVRSTGTLSSGWVVENSTIQDNPNGAGVIVDSDGVLNDDCLTKNGQYGFQTYSGSDSVPVTNLTITNNEISDNDTQNYDQDGTGDCGCTGGAKFWNDLGATVTGNYIHDNESVGLWMDTDNTGFNVSDNYFSHNWDVAIQYEISYNFSITDNTFVDNGWVAGPNNPGTGAIEINNSGSDARVAGPYGSRSVISGNVLTDNWGGVDIYEDSDRFCGTQSDNTSSDYCTLVDPSVYSVASCTANDTASATPSQNPDYFDNCRWKSQNISVSDNTFNFTPSNIGSDCTAANGCGFVGLYSEWGTYPPYDGYVVPLNVVNNQNVVFSDNTYNGPSVFDSMYQGDPVTWAQWSGGWTDSNSGAAVKAQDAGSTFNGSATNPTTTTTTTTTTTPTTPKSQDPSSTSLSAVTLLDSNSPTLRAKVTGVPPSDVTPTGTVTFTIDGSGPLQCDNLPTDTIAMSGGVATCKVTSGLPSPGSPETARATYSGDGTFATSSGTFTSSDGSFAP